MTLAKALGNGADQPAWHAAKRRNCSPQGTTARLFGGNLLARAAALTSVRPSEQHPWDTAASLGEHIMAAQCAGQRCSGCHRGSEQGLMIGIALTAMRAELVPRALEQGLLINVTADSRGAVAAPGDERTTRPIIRLNPEFSAAARVSRRQGAPRQREVVMTKFSKKPRHFLTLTDMSRTSCVR